MRADIGEAFGIDFEIEALNGKATRELASIHAHMSVPPGAEPGRPKYQLLVEELGIA
ncbi:MAG TPA: hypothetical protein VNF72_06025 [Myxococcota bacterium]|nr:hypothetical protein [Myxococcota bacterium]